MASDLFPSGYAAWLTQLKTRVTAARTRAALAVNAEAIRLYHDIGLELLVRRNDAAWGDKVLDTLSRDLRAAFPDMKGFSVRNLKYMRYFAEKCPDGSIGQQAAAQLPWFHIVLLLTKTNTATERDWYATRAAVEGWSRSTLEANIRDQLHLRTGAAVTNFPATLAEPERAAIAEQTLKDPYLFDFLGLSNEAHERDIEASLVRHITRFLLELGQGFAFLGRQVRVEVGEREFFIDLLFYHTRLRCHVVVELKAAEFRPEDAGQLNFYLTAVDRQIKSAEDNPTIGLLLCKSKDKLVAEYALSDVSKPIGIAEYQLVRALPNPLDTRLPSVETLEAELAANLKGLGYGE
jgi:predicted nuclease of restriction endonuclease-like (RecB) superfamily